MRTAKYVALMIVLALSFFIADDAARDMKPCDLGECLEWWVTFLAFLSAAAYGVVVRLWLEGKEK